MRLTIIGCAGSYPNSDSPASCYLVSHEGYNVVLDIGSGSLGGLHRYADPLDIQAVLVSHLHADHFLDLCSYYVLRKYQPDGCPPPIPVFGPAGTPERLMAAYGMESVDEITGVFEIEDFPETSFEVGPFKVTAFGVNHPVEAYALRLEAGGRTLVFSGDTAPCEGLLEAAQGADVGLFEASYRECDDNPPDVHMTAREAATIASESGVQRLILTHLVDWHDNSGVLAEAAVFGGTTVVAQPGLQVEI